MRVCSAPVRLRTGIIAWQAIMCDFCGVTDLESTDPPREIARQFLGMMSHELRTPMQSVLGYTALLLGGYRGPLTVEQRQDLHDIQVGAEGLLSLLEQMLDLSHIHARELTPGVERVELGEHLGQLYAELAPQAAAKGLTLGLDVPGGLPAVQGDSARIRQILHILIDNAIKFTEAGTVHVRAEALHNEVLCAIKDTGIGITPDDLSRIFMPFQQGDNSTTRRFGGAGLGLALANALAQLMDGRLEVESQPGAGTTFTLSLPTAACASPEADDLCEFHCP